MRWFKAAALIATAILFMGQLTIAPELIAPTNAILQTFPAPAGATVVRRGFTTLGDVPDLRYTASGVSCPLNSGNGDNGSQVKSADGKCWLVVPPAGGMDIREWGATPAADIVPYMASAYAANLGVKIIIPAGVWPVQSATTFAAGLPNFEGIGWAEHNGAAICPTSAAKETWLHETVAMTGTTPFTISGSSTAGDGGFRHIGFCQDHPAPTTITASISGTTLTVTAGAVSIGQGLGGTGVLQGTVIVSGTGPYTINNSQNVGLETMTAWAPNVYLPIFNIVSTGGQFDFDDDFAYAIYAFTNVASVASNGRISFRHMRGQPFKYFLNADNVLDVLHGEDAHFWDYWSGDPSVLSWQESNGDLLVLARVDGVHWPDFFGIAYHSCVHFISSVNGISLGGDWPGFYCDLSKLPIWVSANNIVAHFSSAYLAGGAITGSNGVYVDNSATGAQILMGETHFSGFGGSAINLTAGTSSNTVQISSSWTHDVNQDNNGSAVFFANTGNFLNIANPLVLGGSNHTAPTTAGGGSFSIVLEGGWITYTPTLTCSTGALTSATGTGRYQMFNKKTALQLEIMITTNGTCAGSISATLPFQGSARSVLAGRAIAISGKMLQGYIDGTASPMTIFNYDNTYPGANGETLDITGVYQNQ